MIPAIIKGGIIMNKYENPFSGMYNRLEEFIRKYSVEDLLRLIADVIKDMEYDNNILNEVEDKQIDFAEYNKYLDIVRAEDE